MKPLASKKLQNGKYTLNQQIGEGGFGRTYLATDEILDRVVVIKTFKSSPSLESELIQIRKQFLKEAQRLVQCYHPNIVRFYEFFMEDGVPYIVMDYIEGKTLDEIVFPESPLPEATAIKYIRQVGEALKVVHSQGLLHRDIKPQNLILCEAKQQVVLIDFGISREFNQNRIQTHTSVVSDGYAPIEQYLPKAKRTPALDVYALAATLYTLVTAQIPIPATLRNRIALDTPKEIRPELSEQISTAIMLGMALEPEQRPGTVEEWLNWLPQTANNNINIHNSSESVKTIPLSKSKTKRVDLPPIRFRKLDYGNRILQGLIAFVVVIWGLDYLWLRFPTSSQSDSIPLNKVETVPSTQSPAISIEEVEQVIPEEIKESSTNKATNNPTVVTSPEKVIPEETQESSTNKATNKPNTLSPSPQVTPKTSTPSVSPPRQVNPKPTQTPTTPIPPSTSINPPRRIKPKSDRIPSVFVSPGTKVTPKTSNSSSRVPSVFISPNQQR